MPTQIHQNLHIITDPSNQPLNNVKMPILALFTNLTFHHISLLAFLLGAQIYQSFLVNITAKNALTEAHFRILQAAIWPMYFKMHMIVTMLLALTYPGAGKTAPFPGSNSVQGQPDGGDRLTVMLSFTAMFVFSAANAFIFVPKATSTMWKLHSVREEKARGRTGSQWQGDKINVASVGDGNGIRNDGSESPELKTLYNKWRAFHGASYACAMATLATSIYYALCIAERYL
ncbi:hypothetical protein HO173_010040 [Letharia columbiana]|uniref:TMEM205-like domain-containing protein n=1 Tax=Letharia columbiana TaxID=112416 RepID=A0A8H6L193_9LECA|nr:uncharacterized protein HO173_010040 [Letharia columbiana]KAF6231738.1 hypothetical protein HO173_010040 [Letharia columbiana]